MISEAADGEVPERLAELEARYAGPLVPGGRELRAALRGDLHTHSDWSDGGSPIEEMAFTALELGHEYVVLTDHSPRLQVARGLSAERLARQLDVDPKTVERWITKNRVPHPKTRARAAASLGETQSYLWPNAFEEKQRSEISESELVKIYYRRSQVEHETWARLIDQVEHCANALGLSSRRMPSGAGHDAQMFARVCPTAMIFTKSVNGISHNVTEYTEPDDLEAGANVLLDVLLQLTETELE